MKYLPRDIRQIKLVNGDELLTEVIGEDPIEFLIRNPLKVSKEKMMIKGVSREANFFARWMGFSDNQEFIINKSHILAEGIVDDAVAAYYNNMMENIEEDDEVHFADKSEAPNSDLLDYEEDEDPPIFH